MSKLTIILIILGTILILWGIFMLSIHYRYKKRMKANERRWSGRRRELEEERRRMEECLRQSATVPDEGYMPSAMFKTDKLSPNKKIKSHKLVERKHTMRRPGVYTRELDFSGWVPVNNENE